MPTGSPPPWASRAPISSRQGPAALGEAPAVSSARTVPAEGAAIEELIELDRRLRLRYVREQVNEVTPHRPGSALGPREALRVLLMAEVAVRDHQSSTEVRRHTVRFPAVSKTFNTWAEPRSPIPPGTQRALRSLE